MQQVLAAFGPAALSRPGMDFHVRRVLERLLTCRTAALGGHMQRCGSCGDELPVYNSCRDRHCSQCQGLERAKWVEARVARTLPCRHVHMVFTVPAALRPLAARAPALLYDAMFEAVRQTVLGLGRERLGARLGLTAVLHTWNQALQRHPHLHCIVTAGGLSLDDARWVSAPRTRYLFPQAQLAARFRFHLLRRLEQAHRAQKIDADTLSALGVDDTPQGGWKAWLKARHAARWIVYAKVPMAGAEQVIRYLGRYTHRVAIGDRRILAMDLEHGTVRFATRRGEQTLAGTEFVRRFLRHVLPRGFRKVRHYGLLAPGNVPTRLARARQLLPKRAQEEAAPDPDIDALVAEALAVFDPALPVEAWEALASALLGWDLRVCRRCGARAIRRHPLASARGPP